ncbi:MAG TPA: hypothetical protein GX528_10495 [Firmicutes bacterium]|nr:hypothetical protein [Bacillota bacterium]
MSRRKKRRRPSGRQQGINFVITLVTLSIVFGFIGYLIPQYAIRKVRDKRQEEQRLVTLDGPAPVTAVPVSPPAAEPEKAPKPTVPRGPAQPTEPSSEAGGLYRVQVGVFSQKANAERILARLRQAGYEAISTPKAPYRVQTGAFDSRENAENLAQELRSKGFEAIVVR